MESSKSEPNKHKNRGKVSCSSSQSSKFIQKEGFGGCNLSFTNFSSSLCDFIPNDQESLSHEIDFEIAKNLKKLEKKDPLTKQKALIDLLEMFEHKEASSVISTLKFWPKLYNRLSLDEDKKVRELTQQLMGRYSVVCGKELSSYIKLLLPTWIISQSDMHLVAADIAKKSFIETFPDRVKQEKAYLFCWRSIYDLISTNLSKTPLDIKDNNTNFSIKEEAYIQDIVVNIRTIITLIPYLKNNEDSMKDLMTLLKSKTVWAHFKLNVILIQSIYIQMGIELLDNMPDLVINSPTIVTNICETLRMINNYHPHLIRHIWNSVMKCCQVLDRHVWKIVSFKTSFLPKFIQLLQCAADGNMSQIAGCILPILTHLPMEGSEVASCFDQIVDAMLASCECVRILHNELELNCTIRMVFECSIYATIVSNRDEHLASSIVHRLVAFMEKLITDSKYKKSTKSIPSFVNCVIVPLINKRIVFEATLCKDILNWVEKHHSSTSFCENLTALLLELDKCNSNQLSQFRSLLMGSIEPILRAKISEHHQSCLIPYFYVCANNGWSTEYDQSNIIDQCPYLIRHYDSHDVADLISRGLSRVLIDANVAGFHRFLSLLAMDEMRIFYISFYVDFMNYIDIDPIKHAIASVSLSRWQQILTCFVDQCNDQALPYVTMVHLSHQLDKYHGQRHIDLLINIIDESIAANMTRSMSLDTIERLIALMQLCLIDITSSVDLPIQSSFIKNLAKLIVCAASENFAHYGVDPVINIAHITTYLTKCPSNANRIDLAKHLIDDSITESAPVATAFIKSLLDNSPDRDELIRHLESIILADIIAIDGALAAQRYFSTNLVYRKFDLVVRAMHKLIVLHPLQTEQSLCSSIDFAALLVHAVATRVFSSCHHSNRLLTQCEKIQVLVNNIRDRPALVDQLLAAASTGKSSSQVFECCPLLVLCALDHIMSEYENYSLWSPAMCQAVDLAVSSWIDGDLSVRQLDMISDVLLPCAARARYLVRDELIAFASSYLSHDANPDIFNVNRALAIMAAVSAVDASYFTAFYPILMGVKPIFDEHLHQLNGKLNLTALLRFVSIGVELCASTLDQSQWEFVCCLMDALVRSDQFADLANHSDGSKGLQLANGYWLLRLVSSATVSLATSITNTRHPIIEEWDQLFSQPIFIAILDQFCIFAGSHLGGHLVYGDLFVLFIEALADAVSLCPVSIILSYQALSGANISISDPVDFPPDFLLAFNGLLESLSSSSFAVQLAAYNCLMNLTEKLGDLLLDQLNTNESNPSLDESAAFSINLPYKLLQYLSVDDSCHQNTNLDSLDDQIVLVRYFLAWNIVLQLFSSAQPKLRAEISAFLTHNDRCFDKLLTFSFTLMPKNPMVSKRHLTFLSRAPPQAQQCNLIADEPLLLTQCVDERSKFVIYHLSAFIFRRSMQVLPNLARHWWHSLDTNSQQNVDAYVRQFLTRELFKIEFNDLHQNIGSQFDDKLDIKTVPMIGEVTVKYNISCDQSLEQLIKLPANYPIGSITAEYKKEMTVKIPHWKHWIGQMTMTLDNQNGSIIDGIKLWKRNLDNYFNGIEDCMICYSIIHPSKYTLPSMPCYQCKKKFHKECMYKWFHSSTNPTCPNCRNVFYDGSQKMSR